MLLIACGAGSGPAIDRSLPITSMTDQQRHDFCAWQASALGGEGKPFTCGSSSFTVKTVPDCVHQLASAPAKCSNITYGEVKDCTDSEVHDVCGGLNGAECTRFYNDAFACSM
jgi:hypothetical protein